MTWKIDRVLTLRECVATEVDHADFNLLLLHEPISSHIEGPCDGQRTLPPRWDCSICFFDLAQLRIATRRLRLEERAENCGPPLFEGAVSLESAL